MNDKKYRHVLPTLKILTFESLNRHVRNRHADDLPDAHFIAFQSQIVGKKLLLIHAVKTRERIKRLTFDDAVFKYFFARFLVEGNKKCIFRRQIFGRISRGSKTEIWERPKRQNTEGCKKCPTKRKAHFLGRITHSVKIKNRSYEINYKCFSINKLAHFLNHTILQQN